MAREVTITVTVRPHGEQMEINGQRFTDPKLLWEALHQFASWKALKPAEVRHSMYLSAEQMQELSRKLAEAPITLCPQDSQLTEIVSKKSLDEMGL